MGVLFARVDGDWVPVIGTPQAPLAVDEVYVGPSDPRVDPNSTHELWYDNLSATLNAWDNGAWVQVGGAAAPASEVFIGPNDPTPLLPETEMWYDPDAVLRDAPAPPPPPPAPVPADVDAKFAVVLNEIAKLQAQVIELKRELKKIPRPRPHQHTKDVL